MANVTKLHVNGVEVHVDAEPERSLLGVLRDDLALTGAKYGCGEGRCGACTVLIDGLPRRSCVTTVGAVGAKKITTIEGLEQNGTLHPLQQAFLDADAMQCGYCTCGMILTAVSLLGRNPNPTTDDIVTFLDGNICRCGTYPRIVTAVSQAAAAMQESPQ